MNSAVSHRSLAVSVHSGFKASCAAQNEALDTSFPELALCATCAVLKQTKFTQVERRFTTL